MTLKGANTTQACAACKYQRKRCTLECELAPHFRPEQPMVFKKAHKLFGVRNMLRILEQINPRHKTEAMRSIIYEANMRDKFPVHGCLTAICDLRYRILQAEEELCSILSRLAFFKQHHEQQHVTTLPLVVSRDLLHLDATTTLSISPHDNTNVCVNESFWLKETNNNNGHKGLMSQRSTTVEEVVRDYDEFDPFFDNTEDRQTYKYFKEENASRLHLRKWQ